MTSTRAYVLARKSSVIRRARGSTSAKDGRSPKPAKCASIGTPARRIASRPLRPTVTTARSPDCPVISRAANRIVLVLSGPARPRSVVTSTIRRLPPSSRSARSGWSSSLRTAARSARTSSSLSLYGRDASVASWARLSLDAATNCIARVICLMFLTAPMRRRISRWLATVSRVGRVGRIGRGRFGLGRLGLLGGRLCRGVGRGFGVRRPGRGRAARRRGRDGGLGRSRLGRFRLRGLHPEPLDPEAIGRLVHLGCQLVREILGLAQLLEDRRILGLEEAVELGLELLDPRRRDVVELAS